MERYGQSHAVRSLVLAVTSVIPFVGGAFQGADAAIIAHLEREKQERLEVLIEALETGLEDFGGAIPIERSESVIHAAYVTIEATLRTSRREKIRAFGKLLSTGLRPDPKINLEHEYEDYLKILDELSIRELQLLSVLSRFERDVRKQDDENDVQWTDRFWDDFEDATQAELAIPTAELSGLLMRLVRTGTFEPFVGAYWDYSGGRGKLTGAYQRLQSLLTSPSELFDTGRIV